MAPSSLTTILLLLFIISSTATTTTTTTNSFKPDHTTSRHLSLKYQDHDPAPKTIKTTLNTKNSTTKLIKPKLSKTLNTTKPIKSNKSNSTTTILPKTKLIKLNPTTTTTTPTILPKTKLIKLNSTTTTKTKSSSKLNKTLISTTKPLTSKPNPNPNHEVLQQQQQENNHQTTTWLDDGSTDDLIADFRDIPSHLLPDLERLSTTSQAYLSLANLKLTKTVKPYVGNKHAANVATAASAAALAVPLLLLALTFRKLKTVLSLHGLLLFIQAYLAIYFATLAAAALATGLEPLLYLHVASPPAYALVQALQTLGYVVYLVVQMVHLVMVFNDEGGGGGGAARGLGLAQIVVGLAVGVHYYAAVFHWAVAGEALRAGWRVHAAYSACFVVICACGRAEQRKKAYYVAEGGDDGKKS